jgi:hypothetical protein
MYFACIAQSSDIDLVEANVLRVHLSCDLIRSTRSCSVSSLTELPFSHCLLSLGD